MSAITFWYKNYRGEEGYRRATPISLRFGVSEWHKTPQWLMLAFDDEKEAPREFALSDMRDLIGAVPIPFVNKHRHKYERLAMSVVGGKITAETHRCTICGVVRKSEVTSSLTSK